MVSTLNLRDYLTSPNLRVHLDNLTFRMREMLPIRFDGSPLPTIMNGSLWTIPIEMKCYALLGLLGLSGLLRRRWPVLVLTVAALAEYAVLTPRGERFVEWLQWMPEPRFNVEFALFFLAGVLLHRFGLLAGGPLRWLTVASCLALGIAAYLVGRPLLTLWFIVPSLAVAAGLASTPALRRAGRYGDLSFGLYLYAFPVQQIWVSICKDRLPWGVLLALVIATTSVLAFLSWHLVEKHALRLKPRRPLTPRAALPSGLAA
jgi:peptidoglycan/LPS O-acetylase OafA/YrhL